MKFKFFIIGLLLTTFLFDFAGCKPKPTDDDSDNTPTEKQMSVKFGTENAWTAQTIKGTMNNNLFCLYAYPSAVSTDFPCLSIQIDPTVGTREIAEGDFNAVLNPNARQFIEYYHDQIITLNNLSYGDWWVKSGTVSITVFDKAKLTMTGTLTLTMFNAKERYIDLSDHYNEVTLSVTMNQIEVTPLRKNKTER